ncbi:MAG: hypothetical protein HYR56_10095 [Acidobacteria bacterium]|nr:hypothetical protein [Acidobacteriota bacterium]MBI3423628.1 hypothetical protein [Acidobacteriota bacterium]
MPSISAPGDNLTGRLWLFLTITTGVLFITFSFYPGYLSFDSIEQLNQARSGILNDWHPPLMSFIWHFLDRVAPGPASMLLFHNLLFWSGLALFISRLINRKLLAMLLVFSIGFFPPVLALLGTIWKDVGLAASLMLASGLLYSAHQTGRKGYWATALLALFYGLSVRHNGIFAVFPLAIWAGGIACGQWQSRCRLWQSQSWWRRQKPVIAATLFGTLILVMLVILSQAVSLALIQGRKTYVFQTLLLHDLAAVSIAEEQMYIPPYARQGVSIEELKTIYSPREVVPLFCCNAAPRHLVITNQGTDVAQLEKTWLSVIGSHLQDYLLHRVAVFKTLYSIGQSSVCLPFQKGIDPNQLGLSVRPSRLNRALAWRLERIQDSLLFRGWFYLVLLLALLAVAALPKFREHASTVFALGSSALLYALSYFFIAPTCDFRMYWWTVVVTLILPVPIFAKQLNSYLNRRQLE